MVAGDAWWDAVKTHAQDERYLARAHRWYTKAHDGLGVLDQKQVAERLASIAKNDAVQRLLDSAAQADSGDVPMRVVAAGPTALRVATRGDVRIAFTPDSKTLVTGDADGAVKLWDASRGLMTQNWPGHNGQINDLAVSAEGVIITVGSDKGAFLWNEKGEHGLIVASDKSDFRCAAFAPDGRLALARMEDISFWDLKGKPRPVGRLPVSSVYFESLFFSSDSKWMAAMGSNKLSLLGSAGPLPPVDPAQDGARGAAFSPDGALLALAPSSGKLRLYDFALKTSRELNTPQGVGALAFSPDGKTLALGWSDDLQLYDVDSGERWSTVDTHFIRWMKFSPDGKHLATAGNDGQVNLWRIERERILAPPPEQADLAGSTDEGAQWLLRGKLTFSDAVQALAYSGDSTRLAVTEGQNARVFDAAHGGPVGTLAGHAGRIQSLAFSSDGKLLASGGDDRSVRIWDLASRSETGRLDRGQTIKGLGFSADGRLLTICSDNGLCTADVPSAALRSTFDLGPGSSVMGAAISGDGGTIVASVRSLTGAPKLNVYTGASDTPVRTFPDRAVLALSHDGSRALTQPPGTINVVDVATGKPVSTLRVSGGVRSGALHPSGKLIAVGHFNSTVELYSAETGKSIATLSGHTGIIHALAFSPDGKSLATSASDNTVCIWSPKAPKQ
jgi:WD40 repeat protein